MDVNPRLEGAAGGPVMTTKELTRAQKDHETIRGKLDHHDHIIGQLSSRMHNVETGIKALDDKMQTGFADVTKAIGGLAAKQGAGFHENIRVVAMGGSIVAMSAAAIGFLVHSYNAPTLTKLETSQAKVDQSVQRRNDDELAELRERRRKDSERTEEMISSLKAAVEDLKVRVGWNRVEIRR